MMATMLEHPIASAPSAEQDRDRAAPAGAAPPARAWTAGAVAGMAAATGGDRSDPLAATLSRQLLQRYKRAGANAGGATAKRARIAPMNCRLEPFNAGGFAGARTNWISAVVVPTEVPARGKTPVAKACEASGSVSGFDGGHIIGLHLGGQNTSINVVPMYPRFNRGPWKQLEDEIKRMADNADDELEMTVTIAYGHADPRVPSAFAVVVEDDDEVVLDMTMRQPDDIPGITALSAAHGLIIADAPSYARPALEPTAGRFLLAVNATYAQHAAAGHLPPSTRALYPDNPTDRPYGNLDVLAINGALSVPGQGTMEGNREFSAAQRELILALNAARNGGQLVSDDPADPYPNLSPQGTVNAPEIDHIVPKVLGGSNYYSNARVVSWYLNNRAARVKPLSALLDVSRLAVPVISGNYADNTKTADKEARTIAQQFVARSAGQASVTDVDLKTWILTLWPTLGPELPARLWMSIQTELPKAGVAVTWAPVAVPGRRTVRPNRGQAPHRMDL